MLNLSNHLAITKRSSVEHIQDEQHTADVSKVITMDSKVTFEVANSNIWLNHLATTTIIQVVLDRNRPSRPHQTPDHQRRRSGRPRSSDSSNPSIRSVDQNRRSYRPPARIGQSSQSSNPFSQGMNLPQASFVAGAAIHQAHQASAIAVEAATAAQNYQRESLEAQQLVKQPAWLRPKRPRFHACFTHTIHAKLQSALFFIRTLTNTRGHPQGV